MSISKMMRSEFDAGQSLSAIGGVETGRDAAEFLLLGAQTVQVRRRVWRLWTGRCSLGGMCTSCSPLHGCQKKRPCRPEVARTRT